MILKLVPAIFKKWYDYVFNGFVDEHPDSPSYLLRHTGLFKHMDRKEFEHLCQAATYTEYQPGQVILKEGDIGDKFYIIAKGMVKVATSDTKGNEILLAILEQGAYFGEQAVMEKAPARRNATIIALSCVQLLEIAHPYMMQALAVNNKLKDILKKRGKKQLIQKLAKQLDSNQQASQQISQYLDGEIHAFNDKQVIFNKGDLADQVYFILEGKVHIYLKGSMHKPELMAKLCAGQLFGELGVLNKKPRLGTAVSHGPTKLLVVESKAFQRLYDTIPEIRELVNTRKRIYTIPQRGEVSLITGFAFGKQAITATFNLADDRIIIASQVVGENLFRMNCQHAKAERCIQYESPDAIRSIELNDKNQLISIHNMGVWSELGYACKMLLDHIPLESWQLNFFEQTGSFNIQYDTSEIICYCMRVARGTVIEAIQSGISELDTLSIFTGAGSVCGSCRPTLLDMLGRSTWSVAYIEKVIKLAADVRAYHIKLYTGKPAKYQPGQYIVIQSLIDRHWVDRAFTLTSLSGHDDFYEIVVKLKPDGYFTSWLFANDNKTPIMRVSSPHGNFIFDTMINRPAVFFAGGIGITPAIAFVRSLVIQSAPRSLHLDYTAHTANDLLFFNELMDSTRSDPQLTIKMRLSKEQGRITQEEIRATVKNFPDGDFYICGPDSFQHAIVDVLKSCNIEETRIHIESFSKGSSPNY